MKKEVCCSKCSKSWAEALTDFFDDGGEKKTSGIQRFWASLFGSLLFHISLIILVLNRSPWWINESALLIVAAFLLILSALFGLLISTGKKGGLIRRFWYGVSLPAVCYYLSVKILATNMTGFE